MEQGEGEIHGEDDASAVLGRLGAQILKGFVSCEQWKKENGRGEKEENQLRRNRGRRRKCDRRVDSFIRWDFVKFQKQAPLT